ncbi:nucleotide-diphospho-sugar transferase [Fusarium redolens]|uniref:Nucleotide-diphospho-sugar transferase n=1 Tax=Fusarium redolens TaxID=48865 RepID=A0A9P9KSS4_FUSRE|nr:nucleotide-diphospho-sugar transferase [Fusarium redolens]KAH7267851.1 nucleotide-diphospho-sugar transferase [Fusarium redolens]
MTHLHLRLLFGILNILGLLLLSFIPWPTPPPIFVGLPAIILQLIAIFYKIEYVHMVWRWIRYEPVQPASKDDKLPFISIVIPVFNESEFIKSSIKSIELSDYPKDRVELIVIDDGSTDDTWKHVNDAARSVSMCGITLRLLQHAVNMGKRKAIQSGFATALGSIIVSLDSDSVVEKGALRNIVSPLMKDPSIGAVAGHLAVLNVSSHTTFSLTCLLPRLLDIVFDHIGNLPRSALSAEGFVTILPGAFSAFRADAVQCHIDALCTSTFLGSPLKHGEDMELAYRILSDGWKTVYQSNAVVHTMAPETLEKALLMFSRWERTNYTFLCMGYPALTVLWLAMRPRRTQSSLEFLDKEKQEDEPFITKDGTGSIYPLINVACIWLKGPLMILVTYTLLRSVILYPRHALWILLEISILTIWRSFMLIPDALREKGTGYVSDVGGLRIYHTSGRLVWRLVLSWLAGMFQLVILSWTSILGLLTLKSQKWWTR